jgi:hypothetical protein
VELSTLKDGNLFLLPKKIGLQSLSPSYSKMQEAHLYAKFKGEIYTPYIGISLVRSSGRFYKGNYFSGFFSGGSGVLSKVNWWWWVEIFFFFYWWGVGLK